MRPPRLHHVALALSLLLPACAPRGRGPAPGELDAIGERYARLVLALGRHDLDYVDAFYGPAQWKSEAERDSVPLATIIRAADSLVARLGDEAPRGGEALTVLRHGFLKQQLEALAAHARMRAGQELPFDEESRALYGAVAPQRSDASFAPMLARLDSLLPGRGALAGRWEAFRRQFIVPPAKLDTVFRAAIAEARLRTRAHFALPDSESFTVEYVRGQPWSGYNWYQGGYRSLIQVDVDLPIYIDRALDLACHEGYPGHHVNNVLIEQVLVRGRGWKEFAVSPLFTPQSLIGEGIATMAPEVAFPGVERTRFEKEVLCPLAGLDSSRYLRYATVRDAVDSLSWAGIEGARRWLDGRMTRDEALRWLVRYSVRTPERAEKSLRFDERYRSYVVNYALGREIVRDWLIAGGGDEAHPARRWELFQTLLASPRLPADLQAMR